MMISKKTKQKINNAAKRYARRVSEEAIDEWTKCVAHDEALDGFIKGVEWCLKNQDKLSQEEALDELAKICKE